MQAAKKSAGDYAAQFETRKRPNGEEFVTVRENAPDAEDLTNFICGIHNNGETLPRDWLYAEARDAFQAIEDHGGDADGAAWDAAADIYTADLLAWLASFPDAVDAVDEVLSFGGGGGIVGAISDAQAAKRREIIAACGAWLAERSDA